VAETSWVEANWFPQRTATFRDQVRLFLLGIGFTNASTPSATAMRTFDRHVQG
jgi:hypothetical protein